MRHVHSQLGDLNIQQMLQTRGLWEVYRAQLHHFCDDSEVVYRTVSYLRLTNIRRLAQVVFVMSKGRKKKLHEKKSYMKKRLATMGQDTDQKQHSGDTNY